MREELIWTFSHDLKTKKNFSYSTLASYRFAVRQLLRWLSVHDLTLEQLEPHAFNDYLRFCNARCRHKPDLRSHFHMLRRFFQFALQRKLINRDPVEGLSLRWIDFPGGFPAYQGALRKILNRPSAMFRYRLPLFAPYWEAYLKQLIEQGYTKKTLRPYLGPSFYFHRYLTRRGFRSIFQVRPRTLKAFLTHWEADFKNRTGRPWGARYRQKVRGSIHRFLIFAFQTRQKYFHQPQPKIRDSGALPKAMLYQFLDFCRVHKGLKESTLNVWTYHLIGLRNFLAAHRIPDIQKVTVGVMDAFFLAQSKRMSPRSLAGVATAARAFFRYLQLHDQFPFDLAGRLESPCQFSRNRYPKFISWPKVQQLLATIDRRTPSGIRDYALLSMLIDHGLRPGEVAKLYLDDMDWAASAFTVRERKDGTSVRYPLSPHAKAAVQKYLPLRPDCAYPHLFITKCAPYKPLAPGAFWGLTRRYLKKCFGDSLRHYGPYVFRHSFAKALLDRGAKLQQIGTMLGHQRLDSTLIYTQIDTEGLREASDNYADLL